MLEAIKRWSLTSIQTRLIKTGGRLVRHAKRLVFQLAEVMVTRDMFQRDAGADRQAETCTLVANHR